MFTDESQSLVPSKIWNGVPVANAWHSCYKIKDSGLVIKEILLHNFAGVDVDFGLMICPSTHTDGSTLAELYVYIQKVVATASPFERIELVTGVNQGWDIRVFSDSADLNVYISGVLIQK